MGTSSTIAILRKDGTIEQINAHYDGHIYNTGAKLLMYYNEPHKVNELINLGDISALEKEVHPPIEVDHTFRNPVEDVTVFYRRDRGDKNIYSNKFNSYNDYLAVGIEEELNYLFDEKKGKWFYINPHQFFITDKKTMATEIALQPLAPLVKANQDLMTQKIEEDYIEYMKQLRIERNYNKLKKELNNQSVITKKMKI